MDNNYIVTNSRYIVVNHPYGMTTYYDTITGLMIRIPTLGRL